jgi:hypothetical protein
MLEGVKRQTPLMPGGFVAHAVSRKRVSEFVKREANK